MTNDHYSYRLFWSPEDGEYVATCIEFPSLSWLAEDELAALTGLKDLVRDTLEDMRANGERPPHALADKKILRSAISQNATGASSPAGYGGR